MKALIYEGVETVALRQVPTPVAAPGDVLIKVAACGLCGSDMHAYLGHDARRPAPLILGHEVAGTVVGGAMDQRRVTVNPLVTCGTCEACRSGRTNLCAERQIISMPPRQGGFADWLTMPVQNLVTVPEQISLPVASLVEPLACGWHGVRLAAEALGRDAEVGCTGLRAAVLGGGAIGVGAALALQAWGVSEITVVEPNAMRRDVLIGHLGGMKIVSSADDVSNVDIVLDAVGFAATRATACAIARPGGVIIHIGLGQDTGGLDVRRLTLQEIRFIGTYTYTAADFEATAAALFSGRLGCCSWIETRDLADGATAFSDLRAAKVAAPKIVLIP
jgi:L-iditol 2-dehydrogenase